MPVTMFARSLYYLYLIGVEPNGKTPKYAHLELDPKGSLRRLLLTQEEDKMLPVPSFLKYLQQPLYACSAKAANCLMRTLSFPFKSARAISSALPFQAEPLIPYLAEEASFGWSLIESQDKGGTVAFIAATKQSVLHLQQNASCSSSLPAIFPPQAALSQFLSYFFSEENLIVCLHFSEDETFAVLQEGKKLLKSASFCRHLNPFSQEDIGAIKQLIFSLVSKAQKPALLLCTGLENSEDVVSLLSKQLNIPVCPLHSLNAFSTPKQSLLEYASAIGSALCLYLDPSWELKGEEISLLDVIKKWKIQLILSTAASLLLAASIGFFISTQETKNLQLAQAKVKAVEKLFTKHGFSLPYKDLSLEMSKKLEKINAHLLTLPQSVSLSPNVPDPSDVLKWLSKHLVIESSWENEDTGISLESFRYTILERPEEGRKMKGYKVKIDIEILSPSNVLARQFHETLLQQNAFVDPKEEVRWSAKGNLYQASFFLKKQLVRGKIS